MDIQSVIDQVSKRTEKRADSKLGLRVELFLALDELCLDRHWWWRQKRVVIPLIVGNAFYDLSTLAPQFTEFDRVYLVDPSGKFLVAPSNPNGTSANGCGGTPPPLTPLFDETAQMAAFLNTTPDTPSSYFVDTTQSLQNIHLQAPSNVAQNLIANYWAMPMVPDPESDTEDVPIPLVPPFLHYGVCYALERRVFEFLYGNEDPRYTVSEAHYQDFLIKASRVPSWAQGKVTEVRTADSSLAVQAHR